MKNWPELFRGVQDLPFKHTQPVLEELQTSGWQPDNEESRALLRALLEAAKDSSPPKAPPATSSVFEKWLAAGEEFKGRPDLATPADLDKLSLPREAWLGKIGAVYRSDRGLREFPGLALETGRIARNSTLASPR